MLCFYKKYLSFLLIGSLCLGQDINFNRTTIVSMLKRKPKASIVSFEPLGENIALGLDFLLPFINVPILRETNAHGKEPVRTAYNFYSYIRSLNWNCLIQALINVNIAALASTGLLTASSALVSYLFRKYIVFEPVEKSEKNRRSDFDFESEMWSTLNNFKLIYRNSSGVKVGKNIIQIICYFFAIQLRPKEKQRYALPFDRTLNSNTVQQKNEWVVWQGVYCF